MIVFVSNFLNHHQYPVASRLHRLTGGDYRFVEMEPMPESFVKGGYPDYADCPWRVRSWRSAEERAEASRLIRRADVVVYAGIYGNRDLISRVRSGKLTFEMGERWFKRGLLNLFSPNLWRSMADYHLRFGHNKPYRLNCSAYAKRDLRLLGAFRNRCFKWGYFTELPPEPPISNDSRESLRILWVGRFLKLKRPELLIRAAGTLRDNDIPFHVDFIGSGPWESVMRAEILKAGLEDRISILPSVSNDEVLRQMANHDVFVFTSNRQEGWGAVINEAMSSGCAVVASRNAGSVPFLINDTNGYTFKDSAKNLADILLTIARNRSQAHEKRIEARRTMAEEWSADVAASRFLQLIDSLRRGEPSPFASGPCSNA